MTLGVRERLLRRVVSERTLRDYYSNDDEEDTTTLKTFNDLNVTTEKVDPEKQNKREQKK